MAGQYDLKELSAQVAFGSACIIGLVGAFVGLTVSSFWIDELFTAWVVGSDHDPIAMMRRALTDVHPPLYYSTLFLFSQVFGSSDLALRAFSAVSACAAVLVFIFCTSNSFSLTGRLFASSLATGSLYWFTQAQNARSYSVCLFFSAIILSLALRIIRRIRVNRHHPSATDCVFLAVPMAVGCFIHYYILYLSLATLIILAAIVPRKRLLLVAASVALALAVWLYVSLVEKRFTVFSLEDNWIPNSFSWYKSQLVESLRMSAGKCGATSLLVCALGIAVHYFLEAKSDGARTAHGAGERSRRRVLAVKVFLLKAARAKTDAAPLAICVGVPILMAAGGIVSSALIFPNFVSRNLLICSPFLWGSMALLYDLAIEVVPTFRIGMNGVLAVLLLFASLVVRGRTLPMNEPFRESSAWIRSFQHCRSSDLLVVDTSKRAWRKPQFANDELVRLATEYDHYLGPFAQPRAVYAEDVVSGRLSSELLAEVRERVDGIGCPLLGWSTHNASEVQMAAVGAALLRSAGRASRLSELRIERFRVYEAASSKIGEASGFVIYVSP